MQSGESRSRLTTAVELGAWTIVAGIGAILSTQVLGWAVTPLVVVAQSLTPYLGVVVVVVALVALWTRRLVLVTVAAAIGVGIVVLGTPLAFPGERPDPVDGAAGLEVASVNLLFSNDRIADVIEQMDRLTADVIVFTEYTAQHQDALLASPVAERYPYRTDRAGPRGDGVAIWSTLPVEVAEHPDTDSTSIDVTVSGPDGAVRVVAVHFKTPLDDFDSWGHDLRAAARDRTDGGRADVADRRLQRLVLAPRLPPRARRRIRRRPHRRRVGVLDVVADHLADPAVRAPRPRVDHRRARRHRRRGLRRTGQRSPRDDRHRCASASSNALNARPRCEMAFLASTPISANVAPPPSSGWNTES